jgi:hypothetical protein
MEAMEAMESVDIVAVPSWKHGQAWNVDHPSVCLNASALHAEARSGLRHILREAAEPLAKSRTFLSSRRHRSQYDVETGRQFALMVRVRQERHHDRCPLACIANAAQHAVALVQRMACHV